MVFKHIELPYITCWWVYFVFIDHDHIHGFDLTIRTDILCLLYSPENKTAWKLSMCIPYVPFCRTTWCRADRRCPHWCHIRGTATASRCSNCTNDRTERGPWKMCSSNCLDRGRPLRRRCCDEPAWRPRGTAATRAPRRTDFDGDRWPHTDRWPTAAAHDARSDRSSCRSNLPAPDWWIHRTIAKWTPISLLSAERRQWCLSHCRPALGCRTTTSCVGRWEQSASSVWIIHELWFRTYQ